MTTSFNDWVQEFAAAVGLDSVSQQEIDKLLEIAGISAHSSERTAAPLTCWLIGRSGKSVDDALEIARTLEAKFSQ
jgi:hypothetical protein